MATDTRTEDHPAANGRGEAPAGHALVLPAGPLTAIAGFVLVLVAALALREVAELVVPIVFGLFLALIASPLVGAIERRGVRHAFALASAIALVLLVILATAAIIAFSVGELVVQIPRYEDRLRELISAAQDYLAGFGITTDPGAISSIITPEKVASFIRPVASAVSGTGAAIFVLAFTMLYALADAAGLRRRAEAAFGERHALLVGVERFGTDLRRYLVVRALLGVFAAVLVYALLWVVGVPFPALWSFLVFAASFVPNVGFIIALVPPTILALLDGGLVAAAIVVIGYAVINFAQDHLLQPLVMGNELNLSPLVVFISIIAWAWILGAAGALLAVPLTIGLVMILEASPSSRGLATLLRNKVEPRPEVVEDGAPSA